MQFIWLSLVHIYHYYTEYKRIMHFSIVYGIQDNSCKSLSLLNDSIQERTPIFLFQMLTLVHLYSEILYFR